MLTIIIAKGAAVRAAGGGSRPFLPGPIVDNGLPLSHPVVLVPLIGLILVFIGAIVTCFCKIAPNRVPENLRVFGKRSVPANQNVELQLRRRDDRRPSESSQAVRNGRSSRSPSASGPSVPNTHRHSSNNGNRSPYLYLPVQSSGRQPITNPSLSFPPNTHRHSPHPPNNGNRSPYLYLPVQSSERQPASTRNPSPSFPGTAEVTHRKDIPFTPPPSYETVQEFPHLFVPVVPPTTSIHSSQTPTTNV